MYFNTLHSYRDIKTDGRYGNDTCRRSVKLLTFQTKFQYCVMSKETAGLFQHRACFYLLMFFLSFNIIWIAPQLIYIQVFALYSNCRTLFFIYAGFPAVLLSPMFPTFYVSSYFFLRKLYFYFFCNKLSKWFFLSEKARIAVERTIYPTSSGSLGDPQPHKYF